MGSCVEVQVRVRPAALCPRGAGVMAKWREIWQWRAYQTCMSSIIRKCRFVNPSRVNVVLYMNLPDLALVLCVDEKTQIQAAGVREQA